MRVLSGAGRRHRWRGPRQAVATTRLTSQVRSVFTKTESSASLDRLGASRTGTKARGLPP
jgi:hypothetical protein